MAKTLTEKLVLKRQAWINRSALVLDLSEEEAATVLRGERRQSLRLNPLKGDPAATVAELEQQGWPGHPYSWMAEGYGAEDVPALVRDGNAVQEGRAFIQNAASWLPVLALDPRPGERILDVCAAPGGKTAHIAAITRNRAHITANDNSRSRLTKLRANLDRLGVTGVEITLFDATQLSHKLAGRVFDRILLDAPCSGEGLMQLDRDRDLATWSVAQIKRLQQLQKRLITQAWRLLRPGGTLVYSTCTMAPEENEAVVNYILRSQLGARIVAFELELPNRVPAVSFWNGKGFDSEIQHCLRLRPSLDIEAFFVAKLIKSASA